jgi:hypothetical protein
MPIIHESFTVGTSPTLLLTIPEGNPSLEVHLSNSDNNTVYVGDATVATSGADKGLPVKKDTVYVITLNAHDELYAIASIETTANALTVLYSKVIG